jgi:hypothetical protein
MVVAAAAAALAANAIARDDRRARDAGATATKGPLPIVRDTVKKGEHWRLETAHGPVHVWLPPGYDEDTASVIVYAHGFEDTADTSWNKYDLAGQFAASGRNAMFIVPSARTGGRDSFKWRSLGALVHAVQDKTGLRRPWGRVVAVGHSGAYRTLAHWMEYPHLDRMILLDGLYAQEDDYARWLSRPRNRLIMVASDTLKLAEPFQRAHRAVVLDMIPERADEIAPAITRARFIYLRAQYTHMEIVTKGTTIPVLLHWVDVEPLRASR